MCSEIDVKQRNGKCKEKEKKRKGKKRKRKETETEREGKKSNWKVNKTEHMKTEINETAVVVTKLSFNTNDLQDFLT